MGGRGRGRAPRLVHPIVPLPPPVYENPLIHVDPPPVVIPPAQVIQQIQRRAKDPPTFEGKPEDDVVTWLEEYQDTAEFNFWTPVESLRQVRWALIGFAKNWFRSLNPAPATFNDFVQAVRIAFKHLAYDSGVSTQLRTRKQGIDESPVMYCFDKLNLCTRVDPRMTEAVKLDHLIRGMKPTLVEKLYPSIDFTNPNSGSFIQLVQLYHQATWVANSNDWAPPANTQPVPQFLVATPGTSSQLTSQTFVTQRDLESQLDIFGKELTTKLEKDLKRELAQFKEAQEKGFADMLALLNGE